MGRKPSVEERINVEEKRQRLQGRIDSFHKHAVEFWGTGLEENSLVPPEGFDHPDQDSPDSEDSSMEEDDVISSSPWIDDWTSETQPLLLPSNLGMRIDKPEGSQKFAQQEKTLRIGQANDALQAIWLGLSRKSIIFREDLRKARTKTRKLRSWDQIIMVDFNVQHHSRVYRRARTAMVRLGASEEELRRYQVLQKEHLNVTTARIDPSMRGQRDTSLAWFWTMDVQNDMEQVDGMAECEFVITSIGEQPMSLSSSLQSSLA